MSLQDQHTAQLEGVPQGITPLRWAADGTVALRLETCCAVFRPKTTRGTDGSSRTFLRKFEARAARLGLKKEGAWEEDETVDQAEELDLDPVLTPVRGLKQRTAEAVFWGGQETPRPSLPHALR